MWHIYLSVSQVLDAMRREYILYDLRENNYSYLKKKEEKKQRNVKIC